MIESWLASLPRADEAPAAATGGVSLAGLLVAAPAGIARVLIGTHCLDFAAADVADVAEVPGSPLRGAMPVQLRLRPGAPMIALHDACALQIGATTGRLPFVLASRPDPLVLPPSPRYALALEDYMRRHSLEPKP